MKHIHHRPHGYMVIVTRRKIRFSAWIPGHTPESLTRAMGQRDHFLAIAGPMGHPKRKRPHRTGHSNTGIPGITEHTTWSGGRPYPCFSVRWAGNGIRRFRYRDLTTRETALSKAIALRRHIVESYVQLVPSDL